VLAEVLRSGFREGLHRGSVVGLVADGRVVLRAGQPEAPMFPRSASKPLQAAAMLELGLDLDGELLALAAASHSGEPFHLDGVRRILAAAGLGVDALQTPAEDPYDPDAARAWALAGHGPEPLTMNCSGKHAAMLATCVLHGWDTGSYLDPGHQLQTALRAAVERFAGEEVTVSGVDGCGAPLFGLTLVGLARAMQGCMLAEPGSARRRVVDAMLAHPVWVGGTHRDMTALMRGVPGLVAKDGAEGVSVAALSDGRTVAVKIDDGAGRARQVVTAEALRAMGINAPVVAQQRSFPLSGGRLVVGEVRPLPLEQVHST
jgi:L-asparaginase II